MARFATAVKRVKFEDGKGRAEKKADVEISSPEQSDDGDDGEYACVRVCTSVLSSRTLLRKEAGEKDISGSFAGTVEIPDSAADAAAHTRTYTRSHTGCQALRRTGWSTATFRCVPLPLSLPLKL